VLVVGGGANGIEVASEMVELKQQYKRVGLATRGDKLLGGLPERCHQMTEEWLI
jgi:NADH dehydrogenase FAD-containing subunit